MYKAVIVGDVHAVQNELDDCQALVEYICQIAISHACKTIFFLGDLFHTHSTINSYVLEFWKKTFDMLLGKGYVLDVLVGNHDKSAAGLDGSAHALKAFIGYHENLRIYENPTEIVPDVWAIPHYYNNDSFLSAVNRIVRPATIFCHQTFEGAQFDNEFYAKSGVKISHMPHYFIAGHHHTFNEMSNAIYTGAPRWFTLSDANKDKWIWYFEVNRNQTIKKERYSTKDVVTPFFAFDDLIELEPDIKNINLSNKCKIFVSIRGTEQFVNRRLNFYNKLREMKPKIHFSIRTYPTKDLDIQVQESEGIPVAFKKYFETFTPKYGTDKTKLWDLVKTRLPWITE